MREITPQEIEDFIMEYHPSDKWKDKASVHEWVNWMMGRGCIEAFTDDGRNISLVIASRMTNEEDATQDFDIDPEGNCLAIDLIVSSHRHRKSQLSAVGDYLKAKHGIPKSVHWFKKAGHKTFDAKNLAARLGLITQ
jgi:hypothetical protein